MSKLLESFKGKRIFITGHTGFKGSWLSLILHNAGAKVCGYSLPAEKRSHFNDLNLKNKLSTHIEADIRDDKHLFKAVSDFEPEYVFHLAAQALVKKSYDDPKATYETNVMGSLNLLEAVRRCQSVRSLVYITSDKCYENVEWIWGYRENDRLGGHDPYSSSKAAAELVFSTYQKSYFSQRENFGSASVRAGNVIGGGDWAQDRIIPDCIRSILSQEAIRLRSPNATRPWQHVLEPLSGYLLVASKLYAEPKKFTGSWNFGPSASHVLTVYDVAKYMTDVFSKGSIEVTGSNPYQHEANLLQLNCDKAHQLLNWKPTWSPMKTLQMTADWYKLTSEGSNPYNITDMQIKEFFGEA